jgi:hypothetical protein
MNIFVLSNDPIQSARLQCDKHVVKMCLETAQLLCSIFPPNVAPYKKTHYNHPCAKWTRYSIQNYNWLVDHGVALCKEYEHRYNKQHACLKIILWCKDNVKNYMEYFDGNKLSIHPKCMPDNCKVPSVTDSYKKYYKLYKKEFATYTNRDTPDWML